MSKPTSGDIALCGLNALGLITGSEPQELTYQDGTKGMAYVGIHLTDDVRPSGSFWCSRNPKVIGRLIAYGNRYVIYVRDLSEIWGSAVEEAVKKWESDNA